MMLQEKTINAFSSAVSGAQNTGGEPMVGKIHTIIGK